MGSMEEILERVQFKFASIIGELCGEPLVLSQFAIWVDMRLAEYKLKGCISLDCSGKKIEPDWLKSLKSLHPEPANPTSGLSEELSHDRYSKPPSVMGHSMRVLKRPNLQRKASMTTNSHIHTVSQGKKSAASSTITNDVISTTDMQGSEMTRTRTAIVIKNEPSEGEEDVMDLYPVSVHDNASLHRHGTGESMNIRTGALTIRQPESDQQAADDHFLHEGELGMKVRRLAGSSPPYNLSPSSVHESPSSQSLVSIIGAGVHVHDNSQDLNDTADSDMEILNTSQSNIGDFSERGDNCSTSTAMPGGRLSLETGERPDVNPGCDGLADWKETNNYKLSDTSKHRPTKMVSTSNTRHPRKRCRVCYRNGRRRDTHFHCAECPGKPGLCLAGCFEFYHRQCSRYVITGDSGSIQQQTVTLSHPPDTNTVLHEEQFASPGNDVDCSPSQEFNHSRTIVSPPHSAGD